MTYKRIQNHACRRIININTRHCTIIAHLQYKYDQVGGMGRTKRDKKGKMSKINKGVNDKVTKEGNRSDVMDIISDGGNDIINISADELRCRCIIGMVNLLILRTYLQAAEYTGQ